MRALLVVALVLNLWPLNGPQDPVFRARAQTVPVYATVRDASGRLVPGLTRADFQILDDGRPASITTFSNDVLPAEIGLLLDMSTSMVGEHARVRDAALHFVDALLPDDRVRVGTFGDEITLSPWLTSDKTILGRILREEVWPGGDTPLWSAMRASMASLAGQTERRVIVTLTDGIDTGCPRLIGSASYGVGDRIVQSLDLRRPESTTASSSFRMASRAAPAAPGRRSSSPDDERGSQTTNVSPGRRASVVDDARQSLCASFDDVERLAFTGEFLVYAIGMEGPGLGGSLTHLVDDTGGGHFELKRNEDLAATFHEVLDELHHQYALGFTPVALDGRAHALDVRLARNGLTARARKSYLAVSR